MSFSRDAKAPAVSIVMTLMFTHGRALESIESWMARQTFPRQYMELIVVSNGADPALEEAVRSTLSDADRLLRVDSENEMELYDFGARQARAPWILFTEPHVCADAKCLARLWQYLEETGLDGACVRTLPADEAQWVARVEERMYREDAAIWTREGDWRKFTKRGFILRRTAYEAVGGLDYQYLRFAELAIAAKLHAQGFRLGFASEALVTHVNSTKLHELLDYVWEYRQQAQVFEENHPGLIPGGRNFGDRLADPMVAQTMARCARSTLRFALERLRTRPGRSLARTMLATTLQGWLERRCGWSGRLERSRRRYWMARLRLACTWRRPDAHYRAFMHVWQCLGDYAVENHLHGRHGGRTPVPVRGPCRPGELTAAHLVNFYAPERWNGHCFRWTRPIACVAVDLAPSAWIVRLDTRGVRSPSFDEVRLFWNGVAATPAPDRLGHGWLCFRIPRRLFVEPGPQLLTLTCARLRGCGRNEPRTLGLPLFAIEFDAVGGQLAVAPVGD